MRLGDRVRCTVTLDANTDELTMLLLETEDALRCLRYGVTAKVPMGPEHFLSYEKHGADWVLLCHSAGDNRTPLVKASRKMRVLAADSLPALYDALLTERDKTDQVVQDAVDKVRALNTVLNAAVEKRSNG